MSLFFSKALRRAEVFLEQVDESVAQASRRLVVEGATGAVNDEDDQLPDEDEHSSTNHPHDDHPTEVGKNQSSSSTAPSVTSTPNPALNKSSSSNAPTAAAPSSASVPQKAPAASIPTADSEFVNALQEENSDLRKDLENVESELEASRRDRAKLVKNLKRMKEIVSEMDETLRDKSVEARQLNDQILNLKEQLSTIQKQQQQAESHGKDELKAVQKELGAEISTLKSELSAKTQRSDMLEEENERLKDALLKGHEVDLATADGARQEASQAHRAYETEAIVHRQTRQQAKEREEKLQEEAAFAAVALASAQRKAEECTVATSDAKSMQRAAESKLATVTEARDAAFARIEDLEGELRLFERNEGHEAPGQREAKAMQDTVSDLENALEAKNVELTRLEGELEAMRVKLRRDGASPRAPGSAAAAAGRGNEQQDVELKLRHMADAALRKQAQLEVLRSENRALQHQLTTERKRTREAQAMAAAASSSRQSIRGGFRGILESGEDDRTERMYGLRDGPLARFRTPRNWPKPFARMITGLDRFSAQALAFLRKEPLLRIVLIFYVVALHLFVYSLLHWHVGAVSGSVENTHGRIASAKEDGVNEVSK